MYSYTRRIKSKNFSEKVPTHRTDQTDHDLDHLDNLDPNLPLLGVVHALYTRSTDPTREPCARSCRLHGFRSVTRATADHTDQECICPAWQISIIKRGSLICLRCVKVKVSTTPLPHVSHLLERDRQNQFLDKNRSTACHPPPPPRPPCSPHPTFPMTTSRNKLTPPTAVVVA